VVGLGLRGLAAATAGVLWSVGAWEMHVSMGLRFGVQVR
jgi:hypothetical protein